MVDLRVSTTDPDASPMHQKNKSGSRLGYLTHYVVDGGKARVVLNVLVTAAEVTENLPMREMLFRSTFRWRLRPRSVTGDAAYGTRENVASIEKAGVRAYLALPEQGKRTSLFTIEDFVYDAEKDLYTCPQGETLRRQGHDRRGGYVRYAVRTTACEECPLKSKCTNSPKGRWISRSLDEEYQERVRAYRETEAYRRALRKRAVWVEPPFGEAKEWHGSRRFRLRGLEKVNAEALMIASGQNVKRLVSFGPRGPKKLATAAALRPPEKPSSHLIRRHRTPRRSVFQQAVPFHALGGISHTQAPPSVAWDGVEHHHANHDQRYAKTCTGSKTSLKITNPKRSRLLLLARQELDDDPGVKTAMVGAWQDGELRVGESFAQGKGVLYWDLLVAITDHD